MRLRIISLAIILLSAALAAGQSTAVTLQVTDSDGIQWANGTWQVQLIAGTSGSSGPYNIIPNGPVVPNQLQSGGLTSTGAATMTLTPNASIAPAGTIWYFAVCPNATTDCYRQSAIIVGASQTVTLVPPGIRINGANAPPNARAYNDLEIVSPTIGTQYFNVSTTAQRIWLGTIWTNLGGGASSPALTLTNSSNCTTANSFVELDTAHLDATGNATAQTASLNSKKVIGVASSGAGCSGTVSIATSLSTQVIADGQTQVGDWVAASPTAVGEANDYGAAKSTSVQTVGIVSKANTGAGTLTTIIIGTGDQLSNGSSNSNGSVANSGCANAVPYYATTGNAVSPDCSFTTNGSGTVGLTNLNVNGAGTGVVTFSSGAAPSNPASGKFALYGDSGSGSLKCLNSSGGSCLNTTPSWSQITAGSNLFAQTMGSGGSLSPLNAGQVAASQYWLPPGIPVPSTTGTNTGGTINSNHQWLIQISFNTAAGETLPSDLLSGGTAALGGGVCVSNACTLTVVAPSLTGYLSYNVYACDTNGSICTSPQKVAACTAITTNCTFTAPYQTNTSGVLTVATAFVQPPNAQANNGFAGSIPGWFFQKADGNYYPWLGIDIHDCDNTTGPPLPCGTPLITHRTFFSDLGGASAQYPNQYQSFKNAFISINHGAGVGTTLTNQDRALGLLMQNSATDTSTHFSMEGIQAEVDINNAPNITGSPDGEVAAFSGQIADSHTGGTPNPTLGIWGARLTTTREANAAGGYSGCTAIPCMGGARIEMVGSSATTANNAVFASLFLRSQGNPSDGTRMSTLWIEPAATASRSGAYNKALVVDGWFNGFTNGADLAFDFDWTSASTPMKGMMQPVTFFGGGGFTGCGASACPAFASNILNGTGAAGVAGATTSLPIWGSLQPNGGVATNQLVAATVNTDFTCQVTGTTGTNYSYSVVAVDGTGFGTTPATSTCTASAAATLNGSNFVTINIKNQSGAIYGQGAVRYDIYRTASAGNPASVGFLGSAGCAQIQVALFIPGAVNICSFVDNGVAATGTVPTVNTTGGIATKGDYFFSRDKGQHFNTQAANNDYAGTVTLAAGSGTVTFTRAYTSAPVCVGTDQTNVNAVKISTTTTAATFTGNATDIIAYICVGNPN